MKRLVALQEAGKKEAHENQVAAWNEKQRSIFELMSQYNEGISKLNDIKEEIAKLFGRNP